LQPHHALRPLLARVAHTVAGVPARREAAPPARLELADRRHRQAVDVIEPDGRRAVLAVDGQARVGHQEARELPLVEHAPPLPPPLRHEVDGRLVAAHAPRRLALRHRRARLVDRVFDVGTLLQERVGRLLGRLEAREQPAAAADAAAGLLAPRLLHFLRDDAPLDLALELGARAVHPVVVQRVLHERDEDVEDRVVVAVVLRRHGHVARERRVPRLCDRGALSQVDVHREEVPRGEDRREEDADDDEHPRDAQVGEDEHVLEDGIEEAVAQPRVAAVAVAEARRPREEDPSVHDRLREQRQRQPVDELRDRLGRRHNLRQQRRVVDNRRRDGRRLGGHLRHRHRRRRGARAHAGRGALLLGHVDGGGGGGRHRRRHRLVEQYADRVERRHVRRHWRRRRRGVVRRRVLDGGDGLQLLVGGRAGAGILHGEEAEDEADGEEDEQEDRQHEEARVGEHEGRLVAYVVGGDLLGEGAPVVEVDSLPHAEEPLLVPVEVGAPQAEDVDRREDRERDRDGHHRVLLGLEKVLDRRALGQVDALVDHVVDQRPDEKEGRRRALDLRVLAIVGRGARVAGLILHRRQLPGAVAAERAKVGRRVDDGEAERQLHPEREREGKHHPLRVDKVVGALVRHVDGEARLDSEEEGADAARPLGRRRDVLLLHEELLAHPRAAAKQLAHVVARDARALLGIRLARVVGLHQAVHHRRHAAREALERRVLGLAPVEHLAAEALGGVGRLGDWARHLLHVDVGLPHLGADPLKALARGDDGLAHVVHDHVGRRGEGAPDRRVPDARLLVQQEERQDDGQDHHQRGPTREAAGADRVHVEDADRREVAVAVLGRVEGAHEELRVELDEPQHGHVAQEAHHHRRALNPAEGVRHGVEREHEEREQHQQVRRAVLRQHEAHHLARVALLRRQVEDAHVEAPRGVGHRRGDDRTHLDREREPL